MMVTCLNCFNADDLNNMKTIRDSENELVLLCKKCVKELLLNETN